MLTKLMGKGEAAVRCELMELRGGTVEVGDRYHSGAANCRRAVSTLVQ